MYPALDVAKSTVADWVIDFQAYIPIVKQANVTYYKPEALEVLQTIKELREMEYTKVQIMEILATKYPLNADFREIREKHEKQVTTIDENPVMNQVMKAVLEQAVTIGQVTEQIDQQSHQIENLANTQTAQDGRMAELERHITDLQKELFLMHQREKEREQKKGFFKRLFSK